jgi:hypothetical protein
MQRKLHGLFFDNQQRSETELPALHFIAAMLFSRISPL